jgi:hypothetical protein
VIGKAAIKLVDQQYWEIEDLETSGGNPHGIYIGASAASGRLRHFHLRNLHVHNVTGAVKEKASGLLVISGTEDATLEDILIDGITADQTTQ